MSTEIEIKLFESWMRPQVASLFEMEYKISSSEFENLMLRLYEHPYQSEKSVQIVAISENVVVGFQSFFLWPYTNGGKEYYSMQSGNSLVHPNFRGKRIFQRLLNFITENPEIVKADFLIGFPVEASFNSFIKNGWINVANLNWRVKVLNPLAFLFSFKKLRGKFVEPRKVITTNTESGFTLSREQNFTNWRTQFSAHGEAYFSHEFKKNDFIIQFELKIQKRKRIINELVIGNIYINKPNTELLLEALKDLSKRAFYSKSVTIISIAYNSTFKDTPITEALEKLKFKQIDKKIHFIIKPLKKDSSVTEPSNWQLYRKDLDTW